MLLARRARPLPGIDLGPTTPSAQGFLSDLLLGCDLTDRFELRELSIGLQRCLQHAHRFLPE